nr:integrase, catalytic region, zinc finger, CCHC-type, peptidase aspartic, catalytic [Tanacetum cinerariifolium]
MKHSIEEIVSLDEEEEVESFQDNGLIYSSGDLSGKYTVMAVCQIVHCASGLSFLTAVCLIRQRTDFASWQQRIRLYCRGKESEVNILKLIDEGPSQMGTFKETLDEGDEGALHLGLERPRVYSDLSPEDKKRYNTDIRATNILLQGLPQDIYTLINHYTDAKEI